MKIEKDSRQVPSSIIYTADKKYNDLIWCYLQSMSYKEGDYRYVDAYNITYVEMGDYLGLSRQTTKKYFLGLIDLNLIEYEKGRDRYKITSLSPDLAALIPENTMRKLCNTLKQNTISVYAYLLKSWYHNGKQSYKMALVNIKHQLGCNSGSGSNNYMVLDIMEILQKLGLIEYELRWEARNKCVYWITNVKNVI